MVLTLLSCASQHYLCNCQPYLDFKMSWSLYTCILSSSLSVGIGILCLFSSSYFLLCQVALPCRMRMFEQITIIIYAILKDL